MGQTILFILNRFLFSTLPLCRYSYFIMLMLILILLFIAVINSHACDTYLHIKLLLIHSVFYESQPFKVTIYQQFILLVYMSLCSVLYTEY